MVVSCTSSLARVYSVLSPETSVEAANLKQTLNNALRVEEIPADQLMVDPKTEHLLPVAHFYKVKLSRDAAKNDSTIGSEDLVLFRSRRTRSACRF